MRLTIINILILFIIVTGCRKEEVLEMPVYFAGDISKGWVDMQKNGIDMKASARSVPCYRDSEQITLFFRTVDNFGVPSESFALSCFPIENNKYLLCGSGSCSSSMCDFMASYYTVIDDQIEDAYCLNERKPNFLQITDIDMDTRWIEGIVNMHFNHDSNWRPKGNPANPDKVHFYGTFRVKLPD